MPVTQPVDFNAMVNKPTTVSGYGITDASQFTVGQTWQDVKASRAFATTYTNSTGKPITVTISLQSNGTHFDANLTVLINGTAISVNGPDSGATALGSVYSSATFIVPAGATYSATRGSYGATLNKWMELR